MEIDNLKKWIYSLIFIVALFVSVYIFREREEWRRFSEKPIYVVNLNGEKEYCVTCHRNVDVDKSHPVKNFGCTICHGGIGESLNKKIAHTGVVENPARLEYAEKSCGRSGCHAERVREVKRSIMETNTGIISGLLYQWGVTSSPSSCIGIDSISDGVRWCRKVGNKNYPERQFRKFCATCHINKRKGDFRGEIGKRGGGCMDCHYEAKKGHPSFTTKIPVKRCQLCHNRSARTALSYQGIYEDDNYRTPYFHGLQRSDLLSSKRGWQRLLPDIHFEKGLTCIDCHTFRGTMGDGMLHYHMEEQIDISCQDCHGSGEKPPDKKKVTSDSMAIKLARENGKVPLRTGDYVAVTKRGTEIYNLQYRNGKWIYFRKKDGKMMQIKIITGTPYHTFRGHEKLACSACHAAWAPQCYGCHDKLDLGKSQYDKLTMKKTPGRWSEKADFYRFETPPLGVGADGKVRPLTPGCQVMFSLKTTDGVFHQLNRHLGMAAFDPHTTRREVPTCAQCHLNPYRLGLGNGEKDIQIPVRWGYRYALYRVESGDGEPLQKFSRTGARPFNRRELMRIKRAGECVICHNSYTDPIYRDFEKSYRYFKTHPDRCPAGGK